MKRTLCLLAAWVLAAISASALDEALFDYAVTTPDAVEVGVKFVRPGIVRVVKQPAGAAPLAPSMSVTAVPDGGEAKVKGSSVSSSELKVNVDTKTGAVTFATPSGKTLTAERGAASFIPITDLGDATYRASQSWRVSPGEELYGLGNLADDKMSRRGFTKLLMPGNIEDGFPVVQSSAGWGIVWDNYSPTLFTDSAAEGMSFTSDVADGVDYYFIYGGSADGVVAGMRELSGDVPMFPLWTYGFWQSRERYKTQDETTGVVRRYRELGIPLDGIIQDWQYWGNNYLWNAMEFMNGDFSRPQQMIDDIHSMGAHAIISIWSSFGPQTKPYARLAEKGLLFDISTWPQSGIAEQWPPRMDYPSGVRVYNAYSPEARDIYWQNLSHLHSMGLDGWWMDSTEPDHFDGNMDFPTGIGSFRRVRGAYPLLTVGGVHDHQLEATKQKRVFILTRSGWFGQQRYGCNVWTGDVASTWDMLRRQIPSHLNFTLSGNPNMNSDIGGFFCSRYNLPDGRKATENPLFRELAVRWTQLGAFTPMMRSHGADCAREIYQFGKKGEAVYDAMESAVRLRYSLLPYIYSTAREVTASRGSYMRPLVMDFPQWREGLTANDRFMFGRQLLVAPIVNAHYTPETQTNIDENTGWDRNEAGVTADGQVDFTAPYTVEVSLPAGSDWCDFFTGKRYKGGRKATITADISTIPLFARAGSIIPLASDSVNYATEKPWDTLTLRVYPGADGSFELYEDEGDGYGYAEGAFSIIPITYNHKTGTLTIGERRGSYPGMLTERTFTIVNPANGSIATVKYNGKKIELPTPNS